MKIKIRDEEIEITGYVNAVERNSKTLYNGKEKFIERICKGAFNKALKRNDDIKILLNHEKNNILGSTKEGNLSLKEDNIGLYARAIIKDKEVIEKAKEDKLIGWSFGFTDVEVENTVEHDMPVREVKDLNLFEVSILDRTRSPAYEGTLINSRSENILKGDDFIDEVMIIREEKVTESKTQEIATKPIDYTAYEKLIEDMKGEI